MSERQTREPGLLALLLFAVCLWASAAVAQTAGPYTSTLADAPRDRSSLRQAVQDAKERTLDELRKLGGNAALRAESLSRLPAHKMIERLALDPAVGPSTIAAPASGVSVPTPSVNWVG